MYRQDGLRQPIAFEVNIEIKDISIFIYLKPQVARCSMAERDGPDTEKEVEITPAMVEAGVEALRRFDFDVWDGMSQERLTKFVEVVFVTMSRFRPRR
jgi:hypothetical protein